jgi:hypothetical protein
MGQLLLSEDFPNGNNNPYLTTENVHPGKGLKDNHHPSRE